MPETAPLVFALDLGRRTGWAAGPPNTVPLSGVITLRTATEGRGVGLETLYNWLRHEWTEATPDFIAAEAPLVIKNPLPTTRSSIELHGVVGLLTEQNGWPVVGEVWPSTARKHFTGTGKFKNRKAAKAAVVARCHLLELMPPDVFDDDRADAICVWSWACAYMARTPPNVLEMF